MSNFSKFEANVTNLDAIKGGNEDKKVVDQEYSGSQGDSYEVCVVYDDGSWEHVIYC